MALHSWNFGLAVSLRATEVSSQDKKLSEIQLWSGFVAELRQFPFFFLCAVVFSDQSSRVFWVRMAGQDATVWLHEQGFSNFYEEKLMMDGKMKTPFQYAAYVSFFFFALGFFPLKVTTYVKL